MSLRAGDLLKDLETGEERFRIASLLKEGRSFFVALGEDTHLEGMKVVLKAIRYDEDADGDHIAERREAMSQELEALTVPTSLLPEPIDFLKVASDQGGAEPVLVLELISGQTLRHEVERGNGGLDPRRALVMVRELAIGLGKLHEAGFVYRDLNPDHVIVGFDDNLHLVGTGNIQRAESRPFAAKEGISDIWSAPEIRRELSGKYITPRADIYSLGALLAFLLTGVEPTEHPESPLSPDGYQRLLTLKPAGYGLIVSKCLASMAKNRFKDIPALLVHLNPDALPTASTRGFEKVELPEPFHRHLDNRATRSKLSAGPLLSVPSAVVPEQAALEKRPESLPAPWYRSCLPWMSAPLLLVALAAILASL